MTVELDYGKLRTMGPASLLYNMMNPEVVGAVLSMDNPCRIFTSTPMDRENSFYARYRVVHSDNVQDTQHCPIRAQDTSGD